MTGTARAWSWGAVAAIAAALVLALGAAPGVAKKRACKKAKADSALAAKKCVKKKPTGGGVPAPISNPLPSPPAPLPSPPAPPPSVLRVKAEWVETADVDIHIWDASGNHASTKSPNGVPNVSFSADDVNGGDEEVFAPAGDKLIVGVCHTGSQTAPSTYLDGPASVKVTVFEGATARQNSGLNLVPGTGQGSWAFTTPAGPELPPVPVDQWCPPIRGSFTWTNGVDADLHVFDSAGNHASPQAPNAIPNAFMTADVANGAAGREAFYDKDFASGRDFYFYTCIKATNGEPSGFMELILNVIDPPGTSGRRIIDSRIAFAQGDEGLIATSPSSATFPPPFTLPNYCP